jgi:hypothetical protein
LKKGDVFVHADVEGAVSLVVKNKPGTPDAPIPPGTLSQAGALAVATSSAWDSKALMGAWWVSADQVSKTTTTGDYLATGGFVVRGKKNLLPPAQLILGFAVMFQISEASIANHVRHRLEEEPVTIITGEEVSPPLGDLSALEPEGTEAVKVDVIPGGSSDGVASYVEDRRSEDGPGGESADPFLNDEKTPSMESQDGAEIPGSDVDKGYNISKKTEADEGYHGESSESEEHDVLPVWQSNAPNPRTVKHTSARERRLLKKGKAKDLLEPNNTPLPEPSVEMNEIEILPSHSSTPAQSTSSMAPQTAYPNVRGKRGKNKKLASKYKHQDEEDRRLALTLLGSASKPEKSVTSTKTKADREAELEAQRQRRRAQHERAAQAERQRQDALQNQDKPKAEAAGGDGDGNDDTEDLGPADLNCLPSLVGTPVPGDEILAAIPVCAPWSALGLYKYRAKLQPGTVKKGKAVREILGKWISDASVSASGRPRAKQAEVADDENDAQDAGEVEKLARVELELIKGWNTAEVVNTIPVGGVRILTGGGGGSESGGKGKVGVGVKGGGGKAGKKENKKRR